VRRGLRQVREYFARLIVKPCRSFVSWQWIVVALIASHWMKPFVNAFPAARTRVPPSTESLPQKNDALVSACSSMPWPQPLAQSDGCGGSLQSRCFGSQRA